MKNQPIEIKEFIEDNTSDELLIIEDTDKNKINAKKKINKDNNVKDCKEERAEDKTRKQES